MSKYIELEKALQRFEEIKKTRTLLKETFYLDGVMMVLESIPSANVAPVVHGRWEYEPETANTYSILRCSKCGWWTMDLSIDGVYHYCPNCGAKMDLGE